MSAIEALISAVIVVAVEGCVPTTVIWTCEPKLADKDALMRTGAVCEVFSSAVPAAVPPARKSCHYIWLLRWKTTWYSW